MFISINTSDVAVPTEELALLNMTEFNKAKAFILKSLNEEDVKTLNDVFQFDIHPLDIDLKDYQLHVDL